MAGIYIHVPFCTKACHYCDFHFSTQQSTVLPLVQAMRKEISMQKDYLCGNEIETIYFGGGTPSVLPVHLVEELLKTVYDNFEVSEDVEITFEANPEDMCGEKGMPYLQGLRKLGVNRLSVGVQSFHNNHLEWMNRAHTANQTQEALKNARNAGFNSFSVDLIYGIPSMSIKQWQENIDALIALEVDHFSAYCLTVERGTVLYKWVQTNKVDETPDQLIIDQLDMLVKSTQEAGFERYEISNFCKPNKQSVHNTAYWYNEPYLGIGPSAHSYNGNERKWNISNNPEYIKSMNQGVIPCESEKITPLIAYNELVLTRLRLQEGLPINEVNNLGGIDFLKIFRDPIEKLVQSNQLIVTPKSIKLTHLGKHFADGIASQFMLDERDWELHTK